MFNKSPYLAHFTTLLLMLGVTVGRISCDARLCANSAGRCAVAVVALGVPLVTLAKMCGNSTNLLIY